MPAKTLVFALFGLCLCNLSLQTSTFFSLQPAVEALSEREAELALRNEIENGNLDDLVDTDFEWNDDYDNSEQRLQIPGKAMARYIQDYEDFYPSDYRKRAMYRKRDSSVFRERARVPYSPQQQQQALAEKFLRAIEDERKREEEEEYKKKLRNLWNRYQSEEGDMERELFDNDLEADYPLNNEDINRKRNRQKSGDGEVASYYSSDKRAMPLLPWLPATRKKRFPVTKRSPKALTSPETNEKVSQDLKGIFGASSKSAEKNGVDESKTKKKRSSDETHPLSLDNSSKTKEEAPQTMTDTMHVHMAEKKRKREITDPDDEEETDNENDDEAEEEADDGDDSSEDKKKKKKKREASAAKKSKITSDKKPFQWSNIFGIDRKKKSMNLVYHPLEESTDKKPKRSGPDGSEGPEYDEEDYEDDDYRRKKKKSRASIDEMDNKLKTIENLIIQDTAKFYENREGSLNSMESRGVKNRVAERLATIYNIEKMRKAIARLKQSMMLEKNLENHLIQGSHVSSDDDDKKKAKRVAIKKEKAEFNNHDHDIDSPSKKASAEHKTNDLNEETENKEKKKRSQKKSDFTNTIMDPDALSEGFMGGRTSSGCPLLDGIEKKCRGIDIMSGDASQDLLEACGAHQLCYLCGDSQLQCDYQYLNDAEEVCGGGLKCKIAAREALTVLRSLGGDRIAPRECIRNPCLSMALRSIAY